MRVSLCPSGLSVVAEGHSGFQKSTRTEIPAWDALLIVYATMFIPVLFSLMVGINIFVWDKVRINHVFIFGECDTASVISQSPTSRVAELDARSKIDSQEYAEVGRPRAL
jgi:hypothetical protein